MARSRFRLPAWARRFKAPKTVLGRVLYVLGVAAAVALVALTIWVIHLDRVVTRQFEGRRWSVPARVYAQPLELYAGAPVRADDLEEELKRLHYRDGDPASGPGLYRRKGNAFDVHARRVRFVDEARAPVRLAIRTNSSGIAALAAHKGDELPLFRFEPPLIGNISPVHGEDRIVLAPDDVPKLLLEGLKLVEDRRFDEHRGVDPRGIARAMWANLRARRVAQGGSTLTQQLIKSYFLTEEQTIGRKLTEAVMALRLEARFTKQEILNAYVNEVFLGQDGNRAVHGFGLGAQFYFGKPLDELDIAEIAALVGIIKGPGYYDPRRRPERAKARRDLVLRLFAEGRLITPEMAAREQKKPLGIRKPGGAYVPAYLDLVRRHLRRDYAEADLAAAGLQIYTSLDPRAQAIAEAALAKHLKRLDASGKRTGTLEGAVVIAEPDSGDVIAVVGGRNAGFDGFNRALDARRPIGSLVKPAVYLAALETGRYNPATVVEDAPIELKLPDGKRWAPQNYTRQVYGPVPMVYALSESLNLATVRLGLDVGLPKVIDTLVKLGMDRKPAANPALLLGAIDLSPLEVAQLYVPLANGGFKSRLRTVRAVVDETGTPLKRFPVQVEAVSNPALIYQLDRMMTEVLVRGTAAGARLPGGVVAAGKTGTSNDTRDSWFAGFTGTHLAVVWVGYDDNRVTGLTGGSGALPIWTELVGGLRPTSWEPSMPEILENRWIEYYTGLETTPECSLDAIQVPVVSGVPLTPRADCAGLALPVGAQSSTPASGIVDRVKNLLDKVIR
jgi:penicillin-binding protein 1B